MFYKKAVPEKFGIFTRKCLRWSPFLIKLLAFKTVVLFPHWWWCPLPKLKSILRGCKVPEPMKDALLQNLNLLILLGLWTLLYFFLKPLAFVKRTKRKTKKSFRKILIINYLKVAVLYAAYYFCYYFCW